MPGRDAYLDGLLGRRLAGERYRKICKYSSGIRDTDDNEHNICIIRIQAHMHETLEPEEQQRSRNWGGARAEAGRPVTKPVHDLRVAMMASAIGDLHCALSC